MYSYIVAEVNNNNQIYELSSTSIWKNDPTIIKTSKGMVHSFNIYITVISQKIKIEKIGPRCIVYRIPRRKPS